MRPLIRSMFLLSLAVSPLALAEISAPAANVMDEVVTATTSSTSPNLDAAGLRTDLERRVQALESEVARLRTQDEAQNKQFGEPVTAP